MASVLRLELIKKWVTTKSAIYESGMFYEFFGLYCEEVPQCEVCNMPHME